MLLTYKYRLRDGGCSTRRALRRQARAVNYVWNYCCQIDREAYARWESGRNVRRPTAFDLCALASWSALRSMLQYKAIAQGAEVKVVNEKWTSQVCSECGAMPPSRPKGIADLGIRRWDCSDCGASHDRDVNAARNILIAGAKRRPPAVEIPVL